jgi:hypothetical protein
LIIELDGAHHNEEAERRYDQARDRWLRSQGFKILRYWNNEIFDEWEAVAEGVWKAVQDAPSPPAPLREGRGEEERAHVRRIRGRTRDLALKTPADEENARARAPSLFRSPKRPVGRPRRAGRAAGR